MDNSSCILPAFALLAVLCGLRARIDVYGAFVGGVVEGLKTLLQMMPYLCAVFAAVSLFRAGGMLDALQALAAPLLGAAGLPAETSGVILLRPLSGSASLAAVKEIMDATGPDSRAARICCMVSAASETVFFTGSLYMGAAGVRGSGRAVAAALAAYCVGVTVSGLISI